MYIKWMALLAKQTHLDDGAPLWFEVICAIVPGFILALFCSPY